MKIKNAFNLFKQILRQRQLVYFHSVDKVSRIIMFCCMLHNFCINAENLSEHRPDAGTSNEYATFDLQEENRRALKAVGEEKRNQICDSLPGSRRSGH